MDVTLFDGFQRQYPEMRYTYNAGYAETISSSRIQSWLDGVSTAFFTARSAPSTIFSARSATSGVTMTGAQAEAMMSGSGSSSSATTLDLPSVPRGLPRDNEGVETRNQMLERRRRECAADEVDVALAPVMRIPTSYVMYPEQFKTFRRLFPRVTPDPGLAFTHHDHPVAHTSTLVGIRHMQQGLGPTDRCLDIFGNPNGNEQFNNFQRRRLRRRGVTQVPHIDTLVKMHSAMDAVRAKTKWGPERDTDGNPRYAYGGLDSIPPNHYDVFLSIHTLYYMTMREVCLLLSINKNARLVALVNYSPEQCGTLYGELKYSKVGGITTQTSPNGEKYVHPDIDQWFQTNSFKFCPEPGNELGSVGLSWTSRCIGGPLYVLDIVHCPGELARTTPYRPPVAPTLTTAQGAWAFVVRFGGEDIQLRLTNHDLANELRHFMTMRDRSNPQTLADLCVKARRITAPDLVSGTRQHTVAPGELPDHITYAYLVDAPNELQQLEGLKLLRTSLLKPHAEALKLDGTNKTNSFWRALQKVILNDQPGPKPALTGRDKPRNTVPGKPQNSGGLLQVNRT